MDKVSFHHSSVVKDTWEQVGREILQLSAYFTFFNTIENCFSQWKNLVEKQNPKTEDELFKHISEFQNIVTTDH